MKKKLPRALPNFVEQMVHLNLEISADPSSEEATLWDSKIEAKDTPILTNLRNTDPPASVAGGCLSSVPG